MTKRPGFRLRPVTDAGVSASDGDPEKRGVAVMNAKTASGISLALAAALVILCGAGSAETRKPTAEEQAAEEIKKLTAEAASMPLTEFRKIMYSEEPVPASALKSQTLTSFFLTYQPPDKGEKAVAKEKELHIIQPIDSLGIARELYRHMRLGPRRDLPLEPYATLIHADRITGLTCAINGDTATGTVSFRAPSCLKGTSGMSPGARAIDGRSTSFNCLLTASPSCAAPTEPGVARS